MSPFRSASALILRACLMAAVVAGCDCDEGGLNQTCQTCGSDADCSGISENCGGGPNSFCDLRTHSCKQDKFECSGDTPNDSECCPGQGCASVAQLCVDRYENCTEDSGCALRGQVCKPLGNPASGNGCTFERCGSDGACGEGLDCFNGFCVGQVPCSDPIRGRIGCRTGEVCVPAANSCYRLPPSGTAGWPAGCFESCPAGTMLVFKDSTNVFNRCDRTEVARDCTCEALPPLPARDTARHSSAAAAAQSIFVSAYDDDHGDLVVHTFDKTGKFVKTEWIDGVPDTGTVVADPNGPRRGIDASGIDVGQHTSITHDARNGATHVAYYAVRNGTTPVGDLRYARKTGDGAWVTMTVDGSVNGADIADTGLYTSITTTDGVPVIAYFQKAGVGNDSFKTAVKVARATRKDPSGPADWKITVVEGGTRTPPPCSANPCSESQVCVESSVAGSNGICRTRVTENDATLTEQEKAVCKSCGSSESCVRDAANQVKCLDSLRASTLAQLPEGNGLFTSIAYMDGKAVVVWYDGNRKVLKGSIADSDDGTRGAIFTTIVTLDDGSVPGATNVTPHDVGQFASLAVGPADAAKRLAVAYFDVSSRQLRVITAKAGWQEITPASARVVDDGRGTPESDPLLFVGADTTVAFDAQKNVVVAYQDSTSNDLRLAKQQSAGGFQVSTLKAEGAGGFYASLTSDGSKLFVSHAIIKAASASESANKLEVIPLP